VRIRGFEHYSTAEERTDFIHVFGHIMEGRTPDQRLNLSQRVVAK
jgi:5-carboxymethyl-2-hydroxymuconate isomerase